MKTTIYILRHGEVYNPHNILYARLPRFPLSINGRESIDKISSYFKTLNINFIYSSPLLRTRQTATILGKKLGIKVIYTRRLIEIKHLYQGMSLSLYRERYQPDLYRPKNIQAGQESIDEIFNRIFKFIQYLEHRHEGKKIIIVTHGDPILILKSKLSGIKFTWEYKRNNYLKPGTWLKLVCNKGNYIWD